MNTVVQKISKWSMLHREEKLRETVSLRVRAALGAASWCLRRGDVLRLSGTLGNNLSRAGRGR